MRRVLTKAAVIAALLSAPAAHGEAVLNDWCLNLNGDTTLICNPFDPASLPGNIDADGFDFTTNNPPGTANTLGTLAITLGPGNGQHVLAYFDYDLNFGSSGSFQDVGEVVGNAPSGLSFAMADPASDLFADFAANALTNDNTVADGSAPPLPCCDVAFALGISGIDVPVGSSVLLFFTIASTQPSTGFYLRQTNLLSGESIYITAVAATVPLPASLVLLASAFGLPLLRRRTRAGDALRY